MTPRARLLRRIFVGVVLAAIVLCAISPVVLHIFIRRQLQSLVASQLDAKLDIGSVDYVFPYGLALTNVVVTQRSPAARPLQMVTIPRLELILANSPLDAGPLVVEKLIISDPQIHLLRPRNETSQATTNSSAMPAKISSLFQLHEFSLRGGQFIYEDHRIADAMPMVFNQLNVHLRSTGDAPAQYTFEIACDDGRRASLRCTGSANVDDLLVNVASCSLSMGIDPAGPDSTLPANMQALIRSWQARGILQVDLAGTVPLRHPLDGVYHSTIQLRNASGIVPGLQLPIDSLAFKLDCSDAIGENARANIILLDASAGDVRLSIADASATADLIARTWQLNLKQARIDTGRSRAALPESLRASLEKLRLTGAADFALDAAGPLTRRAIADASGTLVVRPHDLTMQPDGFDQPINGFADATVTFANGDLSFQSLRATYADNLLFINTAKVHATDLPNQLRASDLSGCLTLGPAGTYPAALAPYLRDTRPIGPFFFDGSVFVDSLSSQPAVDYHVDVHTTRGRLTLGASRITLGDIDTLVSVTPAGARMSRLNASLLDGSITGTGSIQFTPGFPYEVRADCRDFELKRLADDLAKPGEQPIRISGRGVLSSHLHGTFPSDGTPAYNTLAGDGEFEIRRGDFWELPILGSIAGAFSKDSLTFGAAAGQFRIGGGKTHFNHIVVSSPLLGVEGSGDVAFTGALNLEGIADPFGSWGDRIAFAPLSAIFGAVQRTINFATSQVLYQIRVTGTTSNPKTSKVLAPLVTHGIQQLLMLTHNPDRADAMVNEMHQQKDASQP
jgi:uncharacterized protein involved in outer membrane biogenesis